MWKKLSVALVLLLLVIGRIVIDKDRPVVFVNDDRTMVFEVNDNEAIQEMITKGKSEHVVHESVMMMKLPEGMILDYVEDWLIEDDILPEPDEINGFRVSFNKGESGYSLLIKQHPKEQIIAKYDLDGPDNHRILLLYCHLNHKNTRYALYLNQNHYKDFVEVIRP